MNISFRSLRQLALFFILTGMLPGQARAAPASVEQEDGWTQVVRNSPYWVSQGVYHNILTIRSWVLGESGYCAEPERHILFDMRGQFLAWMSNGRNR
jgi:hypothetical protein